MCGYLESVPRIHVERMRRGGLLRACISVSLKDVMSLQAPFGVCGTLSPTPRVLGYVCTAFPFARVPIESRCEKGRWKKNSNVSGGLFSAGPAMRQDTMQTFLWAFAHKSSELVFFLLVLSQLSLCFMFLLCYVFQHVRFYYSLFCCWFQSVINLLFCPVTPQFSLYSLVNQLIFWQAYSGGFCHCQMYNPFLLL